MATYPTSLAPDKTSVDPTGAITLTWTVDAQTHYQINYRRKGTTTWVQTGKISSTTKSYTIPANTLLKNEYYEWMVRVWYHSTQYAWSARATFLAAVPASALVKETHGVTLGVLRVVPLGKSTDTSNLRVKLASGTAEFDLVAPTHQAASQVRIATGTAVKAIAKPITTEVYSNYGDTVILGICVSIQTIPIMAMIITQTIRNPTQRHIFTKHIMGREVTQITRCFIMNFQILQRISMKKYLDTMNCMKLSILKQQLRMISPGTMTTQIAGMVCITTIVITVITITRVHKRRKRIEYFVKQLL